MKTKKNGKNEKKVRGRPAKKIKNSLNVSRKKIETGNVSSKRTMYRRANEILNYAENNISSIELAAQIGRKRNIAENNNINEDSCISEIPKIIRHTAESGLAFYLEYNFSKRSHEALSKDSKSKNCSIYPCYTKIQESMLNCKPLHYKSSEIEVLVPLTDMFNKTSERLCESSALNWNKRDLHNLELLVTIGFDSSSGHTNPHQKCQNPNNDVLNASQSLFVSSMIIIKLTNCRVNKLSWTNPTPQSVRFCRPLRFALEKEDDESTIREFQRLNKEIEMLKPHKFTMSNGKKVTVKYKVTQTLFDGKCLNTIVGNKASCRCPMCLKTSHQFCNLKDDFNPVETSLEYGLGLLHCEIKAFEHLLHLSYRKTLQLWDVKKDVKDRFETRKMLIQEKIFENFGIRVDQVLQGHGTTNTGNLARTCFQQPKTFAEVLEIDEQLVSNIAIILQTFKCKKELKLDKLETFCWQTYCRYYKIYPWARMSPTLHKLLKHGCQNCRKFPVPIAYFAEDANESWHKFYRKNFISHARQNSRKNRILDVFNRAVYLTDPLISLIYLEERIMMHKKQNVPEEIKKFIKDGQIDEDAIVGEGRVSEESDMETDMT